MWYDACIMSNYNYNPYGGSSPGPGPGTPPPQRGNRRKDWTDTASWVISTLILVSGLWPVGLFLTIAHATGHDFVGSILRSLRRKFGDAGRGPGVRVKTGYDVGQNRTTSSRVYADGRPGAWSVPSQEENDAPAQAAGQTQAARSSPDGKAAEAAGDGVDHIDKGAMALEVAGWIVAAFGAVLAIGALGSGLWSFLAMLAIALGGGVMIFAGRRAKRREKAFRRCMTISGDKGIVKIDGLARTLGMSEEDLAKQLDEMVDRGYYGTRAYVDHARGLLVIEPEDMRYVYKAEDEARSAQQSAAAAASMSEYDKILGQIHQADLEIKDEVMSEKIRTMQELTAAIFREVEDHPEKKPQIQRFMNYYLPTTLKLLDSYARIEQQGVSGDNMAKAKADIERIADTLVDGYKKQLDTLYRAEAVDIAGDVSVIENMMRRDGLTGQDDFRLRTEPEAPFKSAFQTQPEPQVQTQVQTQTQGEGQTLGGH